MRLKAKRASFEPNSQLHNQSIYLSCIILSQMVRGGGGGMFLYIWQTNFPGFHGSN